MDYVYNLQANSMWAIVKVAILSTKKSMVTMATVLVHALGEMHACTL